MISVFAARTLSTALAALSFLTAGAGAVAADSDPAEIRREIVEHDANRERRVVGVGRLRISHPQRLSGALGAMFVRQPADYDCTSVCEYRGLLLQAEPGLDGGQISAGYAVLWGEKDRRKHLLSSVFWTPL